MIELQPFTRDDFPQMIDWAVSPEFLMQWCGWTFAYPLDTAQLERYLYSSQGEHPFRRIFSAVDTSTQRVVGHIALSSLDPRTQSGTIACVTVDAALRGKGVGEAMVRHVLETAFDELHLHRVELNVFDFNTGAIALYEKLGFVKEGLIREARRVGDTWWSHYHMSMLEQEWRAKHRP